MKAWLLLMGVVCACVICACVDAQRTSPFLLSVHVVTDTHEAVPHAKIVVDEVERDVTGVDGVARIAVSGVEGRRVQLRVRCPARYRQREVARDVALRRLGGLDGGAHDAIAVEAQCIPLERRGVLVVRAKGAQGVPVLVDGKPAGTTDANGLAHIALRLVPATGLLVTLDTTQTPKLRPANPSQRYVIEDRDAVLVFDQAFTNVEPPRKRRPRRVLPYRVQ